MTTDIQALITKAAQTGGIDPTLALAVAQHESGFSQAAVGSSGEQGVFQILPSTAQDLGINPADLQQNIAGGTALLSHLLEEFGGDEGKALAAYNCGATCVHNAIARGGSNWYWYIPKSTYAYVTSILGSIGATPPITQAVDASHTDASTVPPVFSAPAVSAGVPTYIWIGGALLAVLAVTGDW